MFACLLGVVWLALGGLCGLVWSRLGWSLGGSALDAVLGHFPAPLGRLKNAQKNTHNTTEICDLGSSLEGLLGAQKRHLEITDSSCELRQKMLGFSLKIEVAKSHFHQIS